jgi:hypothetical protein
MEQAQKEPQKEVVRSVSVHLGLGQMEWHQMEEHH